MTFAKRILAAYPVVILLISFSTNSFAQSESDLAETHFKAATAYYNQGKYEKALEEFNEAYRLMPLPEITFNIAQCHERLGDIEKAIEIYNKYIEEKPDAKDLQAVKDKIENLVERLESTGIHVTVAEEGATIFVDGQDVATSPLDGLIKVAPGSHELKVEKEGFQTFTMKFSVSAGLTQSATVTLTPHSGKTGGEGEGGEEGGEEPEPVKKPGMAGYYAGYGVSGAVLIAGGAMGVMALVNVQKANDAVDNADPGTYNDRKDKAKKFALAADVMIPVGVAGLVITSIILGVKKPWKEKKKVSLVPSLSPMAGGLSLQGSF
jgi:tetratricopeptide (TPR) repeat protein